MEKETLEQRYSILISYSSWLALGLDSTYVYRYQGALLPVDLELSQRHPQNVLCSSSGRAENN